MPRRAGRRSPVTKISVLTGTLRLVTCPTHVARPVTSCAIVLMRHTLVDVEVELGAGTGGLNRQPAVVHVRALPVSVEVVAARTSLPLTGSQLVTLMIDWP